MVLRGDATTWDWTRPIFDHVHLRVRDLAASTELYGAILEPLGVPLMLELEHMVGFANLALSSAGEGEVLSSGVHIAFAADSQEAVDEFHRIGLEHGATDNGAPGVRPYGPPGMHPYAAYLLDLDGNNIEAAYRGPVG